MKQFLRVTLTLLFAFKTFIGIAHAYDSCLSVTAPNLCSSFEFEIDYLIVKPSNSNLDYAALAQPFPYTSPDWRIKSIKPNYQSAFELVGGYVFPNLRNLIRLSWTYLYACDSNSARVKGDNFLGPPFIIGTEDGLFKVANGKVRHRFDAVNLNFNQRFDVCDLFHLRLFGGVSFVRIDQKLKSFFRDRRNTVNLKIHQDSEWWGVGPQIGLNMIYPILCNLDFVAEGSASLLVGRIEGDVRFKSNSIIAAGAGFSNPNIQHLRRDHTTQLFYGFDGKLGLGYEYIFCNESVFTFEVGYRAAIYINTIQSINPFSVVVAPETGTIAVAAFEKNKSDFGFHGPYFAFRYEF